MGGEGAGSERGEKLEKREGEKKIWRVRSACRSKKEGGRQGAGRVGKVRVGKEVDGGEPSPSPRPPPCSSLYEKAQMLRFSGYMADFNPRRQYIGVNL